MAQDLPIHILNEIERRWQRRLDSQPQTKGGANDEPGTVPCPHCGTAVTIEPTIPGDTVAHRACDGCGHIFSDAAQ